MNNKKNIIQVAPLIRLPIARTQVFSYLFQEPIKRGSLVEIPFYNRVILGIVMDSRDDFPRKGNFELKRVKRIAAEEMLSEKQIEFAKKMADFYLSPLGIVLKIMVPKIVKTRNEKKTNSAKLEIIKIHNRAKEIFGAKNKEIALIGPKKERDEIIFSAMHKAAEKNKQFLYIASEIFPAAAFFEKLKKYFPANEIALVHGSISKGEFFEAWERIRDGKVKIIVATKTGLFLPFRELDTIAVEESGDISHKQWDMNPRYNAARSAQMLADTHDAKIIYSNSVFSSEIWKKKNEKDIRIIDLGADNPSRCEIKITNVFEEKKSADFPIGKELHKSLSSLLDKKEKALLVVNRKGFSSYSVCRSCKTVLRCPDCNRALVYFEEKEKYQCLHCSHVMNLLSSCPTCGASQFSHQGVGIQLVERKIKRLFPSARILRLDTDASKSKKNSGKILEDLASGNFDVLIGTQIALKIGSLQEFDLVAFPSFDDLGSIPDFNTRELIFAMLGQAEGLTRKKGILLIQTTYPDSFLLDSFRNQKTAEFFEKELNERKKTDNPPFSRIIKLFYRDRNKKKVETEAKKTFSLLQTLADSNIDTSEPFEPFAAKKRGYYLKNILIKFGPETNARKSPVFPVLGGLKKGWAVDVDPMSTI
ncbi:MAG: primosomal protein N' [Candidatus Moranbacteria bacterium]|nr:primosomal protein N' [Candidatus Moranbacteria bacterium]